MYEMLKRLEHEAICLMEDGTILIAETFEELHEALGDDDRIVDSFVSATHLVRAIHGLNKNLEVLDHIANNPYKEYTDENGSDPDDEQGYPDSKPKNPHD